MKVQLFTLALLASIALATSAAVTRSLQSDFKDFDDLLPKEAVKAVVDSYVQTNEDVQAALAYMQTDEFRTEYRKILRLTVVRNVVDYLQDAGVNVVEFLNKLADLLGVEPYQPPKENISENSESEEVTTTQVPVDGVDLLVEDVLNLMPQAEAKALFDDKLETSPEFAEFVKQLKTKKFKTLIYWAANSLKLEKHLKVLRANHLDANNLYKLVRAFFGYSFEELPLEN